MYCGYKSNEFVLLDKMAVSANFPVLVLAVVDRSCVNKTRTRESRILLLLSDIPSHVPLQILM